MRRSLLLLAALGASPLAPATLSAQDAKPPAQKQDAPAAAGAKRTPEQLEADLQATSAQLRQVMADPAVLLDPARRKAAAPQVVPLLKRMSAIFDEMLVLQPEAKPQINDARMEFTTILALFGDADAAAALEKLAKTGQGTEAVEARCGQQVVAYLSNPKDEAGQLKVLDEMRKIAKADPKEDAIGQTLIKMANMGAASKAVADKAEDILIEDLTGDYAREVGQRISGQRKLQAAAGKPIELAGTQPDGSPLSTKNWKGKVVLVDFWATWCPPCIEGLPRLKKLYVDHHAKGLEILGISSDAEPQVLKEFLAKNKDMPWPQIVDPKANPEDPLHPLARQWGLRLPTLLLIDRKGVLRSIDADRDLDEMIPKLLAEKAE